MGSGKRNKRRQFLNRKINFSGVEFIYTAVPTSLPKVLNKFSQFILIHSFSIQWKNAYPLQ